jgi:tRNA(Ile)-lysidine synthase
MLRERVLERIERLRMLDRGDRVVVAVSGGVDSVVLVRLLASFASASGWDLTIAHLDHRLRKTSGDDARFVVELGKQLDLPVIVDSVDVEAHAASAHSGLEQAAREVRRAFLERVAREVGAGKIALGHTADDQAETILFQVSRGAGWDGASGVAEVSLPYVRPLLHVSRAEVQDLAEQEGWPWREDETNADLCYSRNRIRHRVLPELREINPEVVSAFARLSEAAGDARQIVDYAIEILWPSLCLSEEPHRVELSRPAMLRLPGAIRRVMLRDGLRRLLGGLEGIERTHLVAADDLAEGARSRGELHLPRSRIRVSREKIVLTDETDVPVGVDRWSAELGLGRTEVPEQGLQIDLAVVDSADGTIRPGEPRDEVADADCVAFPLAVRNRREGDRFHPLGMPSEMKLKDFLIAQRVPVEERERIPLICDRNGVIWVAGLRLSERVKSTPSTRRLLRMHIEGRGK